MMSSVPPPIFSLWWYGTPFLEEHEANKRWLALEVDQKSFECAKAKTFALFHKRLRLIEVERKELFSAMKKLETRDMATSIERGQLDFSWEPDTLLIKQQIAEIDKTTELILKRLTILSQIPTPRGSLIGKQNDGVSYRQGEN
jgi:hypothetical protein